MKKRRILVVAAHPDDEVLGCGATIARLAKEGAEVFTLILGQGILSRGARKEDPGTDRSLRELKDNAIMAGKILGVKEVVLKDLPDNRFDSVDLLDVVKIIEDEKRRISPCAIFTHHGGDLNIDHNVTYRAVLTAARPVSGETVREIYSFEVLSSTEWNHPYTFSPNVFFDVSDTLELKVNAMNAYPGELREFPHPRSVEGISHSAAVWGMRAGVENAEAFEAVRVLR